MDENAKQLAALAVLVEKVRSLEERAAQWVTLDRFWPVQKLVYGMVGLALIAMFGALLALVVRSQ